MQLKDNNNYKKLLETQKVIATLKTFYSYYKITHSKIYLNNK